MAKAPTADAAATTAAAPPYLELAVQKSPENVVARWLWQPVDAILSSELYVRVGGSFVWPPPGVLPTVGSTLTSAFILLPCPPAPPSSPDQQACYAPSTLLTTHQLCAH